MTPTNGFADESPASVELGIEGFAKRGYWAQARCDDARQIKSVHGFDGEGFPLTTETSGSSPGGVSYVKLGRELEQLSVRLASGEILHRPITRSRQTIVTSLQQLVLVVGGDIDLAGAIKLRRRAPDETIVGHDIRRPALLPLHPLGYDGVDALILCTANTAWLNELTDQHWEAIDRWVRSGGCLVISAGVSAVEVFGEAGKLTRFLSGKFGGPTKQRETSGIEAFVRAGTPIQTRDEIGRIVGIPAYSMDELRGQVLTEDGTGNQRTPWLVQSAHGMGTVLLVATDLDAGPLAVWRDRPRFVGKILDTVLGFTDESDMVRSGQVRHLGFTDLAGQLRASLDQFAGVWLVPFSLIAGLLATYVLLLGPVDYFLLRQFGGQMHWTWLTFPLVVLGTSIVAGVLVNRVKSDVVQLNQVDLVDVDLASGDVRARTWAHLYSPSTQSFGLELQPGRAWELEETGCEFSWQGLPGGGFSGLEGQGAISPIVASYTNPLRFTGDRLLATLADVGVPARSTRSFTGTWNGQADFVTAAPLLMDREGLLGGEFSNPLPIALRDAAIVCDQWYYKVGTLKPGQVFSMSSADRPLNFSYRLMRRRVGQRSDRDFSDLTTPWDRASFDIARIMEMLMFHEAASGRSYTNLMHQFHGELDLTGHLQMQVAVLFGRLETAASRVLLQAGEAEAEAEIKNWAFGRILIPVNRK